MTRPHSPSDGFVQVRGAREHNLKNVDLDIPRNAMVVFTGVSGSGKSSLAFGTLYAEAQRRYFDSVAPYARRLIEQAGVPEVDAIHGLPPAVALQQQRGAPTSRSSVGSVTTLSNSLRMLYSRAGTYPPGQPRLDSDAFSPNTPAGACPTCHGLGRVYDVTEQSMVPDDTLTIRERAVAAWPPAWHGQNLRDILVTLGYDVDTPWKDLPRKVRDWILFTEEQPVVPVYAGLTPAETRRALKREDPPSYMGTFTSARRFVLHTFATTQSELVKRRVSQYLVNDACPTCAGKRLRPESLAVKFAGHDIGELAAMPLARVADVLREGGSPAGRKRNGEPRKAVGGTKSHADSLAVDKNKSHADSPAPGEKKSRVDSPTVGEQKLHTDSPTVAAAEVAERITGDLIARIGVLTRLGLGYLSLDRATPTLSPGELQRLRLATQLHASLFGVVYVLDEPSAGLHPADGEALIDALEALKQAGNSLFVVEHDLDLIRRADWIVDVGPAAGEQGGQILYSGPPEGLARIEDSQTRAYLFDAALPTHTPRAPTGWLALTGVDRNNLQAVDVAFPLGAFTAVTGVSGSGKSSLVSQVLVELVAGALGAPAEDDDDDATVLERRLPAGNGGRLADGLQGITRLVRVDQKPIGRTPRSNLATYTGLFDQVRKLFAATPAARKRRYDAGRFSFNVAKGRCPTCEGEGFVSVELLFLPSVYAPCPTCDGARYNPDTLEIRYRERNIAEVLGMAVNEACDFFADDATVLRPLIVLRDVGLGYLRLGQPATELSGGEAQRIKLATELQRTQRGTTLYVLDEPTTGLHPSDVARLMAQLHGLVDAGNTVVVVEHEMNVVAASDWVIDVGPGAGDEGGAIVAAGTPAEVARHATSRTAPYLAAALGLSGRKTRKLA